MFNKVKLIDMVGIYTVNAFYSDNKLYIGCGPEKQGKSFILEYPSLDKTEIAESPGGMMSLIPVAGETNVLISVMGLFPPFIGKEAGIYSHILSPDGWAITKVMDIPFAHRCEILHRNRKNYLFTSTVSSDKQDPSDWSNPGQVFLSIVDDPRQPEWKTELIMNNIFRNHGMLKTCIDGKEVICVSGTEGIYSLYPDDNGRIITTRLFDKEVSEFAFIDINNDGLNELVTIEPFHGNSLHVYTQTLAGWQKMYDAPLYFGHGLSIGILAGSPSIVVGNRSDEASLNLFQPSGKKPGSIDCICVERGTGTTQTQIFRYKNRDYILSANQLKNEAALYSRK